MWDKNYTYVLDPIYADCALIFFTFHTDLLPFLTTDYLALLKEFTYTRRQFLFTNTMEGKWSLAESIYSLIWIPAQRLLQGKCEIKFLFLKITDIMMSDDVAKYKSILRVNEQQFNTP
jgi:hypothetical protein